VTTKKTLLRISGRRLPQALLIRRIHSSGCQCRYGRTRYNSAPDSPLVGFSVFEAKW
jgi:hypothetical protein